MTFLDLWKGIIKFVVSAKKALVWIIVLVVFFFLLVGVSKLYVTDKIIDYTVSQELVLSEEEQIVYDETVMFLVRSQYWKKTSIGFLIPDEVELLFVEEVVEE